ncbi:glycerol kinase GlpK [Kordiimonas sp. SCSIO 12610]|uniref:glycerol kinase GlpK n=1 Tax=Kordiimonas sp. SCSIO 12610 TaxID=2829597 RepID=UPI00210D2245|nr:glycerol kinase GlpK [Kordiimonas sp. SCSIO 12610]UTW55275.1 glycerol kinase GlpK [Kordiimonas sp. SCSIO 12610]
MADKIGILSIDQGTTSSRAIVFDSNAQIVSVAQQEFTQYYPNDGWVEHDAEEIWSSVVNVCQQAINDAEIKGYQIKASGITNQRETTVVWNRKTGKAIYNAIVWQDRRTAETCRVLSNPDTEAFIKETTGLRLDPYFSATKIAWILDNVEGARSLASMGELAFGTIDSFLIWRLTNGHVHATDATNASRTNLYNIKEGKWDEALLNLFNVPSSVLPEVKNSADNFGDISPSLFGKAIPITGVAGDQQAATVGQACFEKGDIKSTYGTGCFVMQNTGDDIILSNNQLLTTIAYQLDDKPTYALEGSIFIAGAAVQWLRDELGVIENAADSERMIEEADPNTHIYLVPAFTGLGAPHWNPEARGAIFGLTRASGPNEFVRAAVESVCYQTHDLLAAMKADGAPAVALKVDGGMVANNWMCDFLSSILELSVQRPTVMETTALGAAYLAGLEVGIFKSLDDIRTNWNVDSEFNGSIASERRDNHLANWQKAVQATLAYAAIE